MSLGLLLYICSSTYRFPTFYLFLKNADSSYRHDCKIIVIYDQLNLQAIPFKFRGTAMKFSNDRALRMSPTVKGNTTVPHLSLVFVLSFCFGHCSFLRLCNPGSPQNCSGSLCWPQTCCPAIASQILNVPSARPTRPLCFAWIYDCGMYFKNSVLPGGGGGTCL